MFGRKKKQVSLKKKETVSDGHKIEAVKNEGKEKKKQITSQDLRSSTQVG